MPDTRFPLLGQRILSALVLIPLVLAAVWLGMPWLGLLVGLAALLMAREWSELCLAGGGAQRLWCISPPPAVPILVASVAGLAAAAFFGRYGLALGLTLGGAAAVGLAGLRLPAGQGMLLGAGVLYIGLPVTAVMWLGADPEFGRWTLIWLLLVVWATDSGGYVVGKLIGGPRLAPVLSPNKTWAGVVGGLAFAALAGAVMALCSETGHAVRVTLASLVLSLIAQGGDLAESAVKRHFDLKDSGTIIPGHGGLFDRLDGLLAAAPAVAAAYAIAGGGTILWR